MPGSVEKAGFVRPGRLVPGDCIGIAAPASPFDRQRFDRGVRMLHEMGFRTLIDEGVFEKAGYLAGSDEHRAQIINRLFARKHIKAVFCARGGFGSMKILPFLDYPAICRMPKIVIGFSDVTALLTALQQRCGLVVFHGPMVTTLAECPEETGKSLLAALCSDSSLELVARNPLVIRSGTAYGKVCGGNLSTLCHLVGTAYMPCFKRGILLLEERGEPAYRIDRMLSQMKMAGCFSGLAGLVLGDFQDCGPIEPIVRIIEQIFEDVPIPIVSGFNLGHDSINLTAPLGLEATLDARKASLKYLGPATISTCA